MRSFLTKTAILSIILITSKLLAIKYLFPTSEIPYFILIVCFFFVSTNIVHFQLLRIARKNLRKFNPYFLGMNMIKLFAYFILALVYMWFNREFAKEFFVALFVIYLTFSIIEVVEILRVVKPNK